MKPYSIVSKDVRKFEREIVRYLWGKGEELLGETPDGHTIHESHYLDSDWNVWFRVSADLLLDNSWDARTKIQTVELKLEDKVMKWRLKYVFSNGYNKPRRSLVFEAKGDVIAFNRFGVLKGRTFEDLFYLLIADDDFSIYKKKRW